MTRIRIQASLVLVFAMVWGVMQNTTRSQDALSSSQRSQVRTRASRPENLTAQGLGLDERGRHFGIDVKALRANATRSQSIKLQGISLEPDRLISLSLERFTITTPETRFVKGHLQGHDEPIAFDPDSVLMLRGTVEGHADSAVFLSIADSGASVGTIDLGKGRGRWQLASKRSADGILQPNQITAFPSHHTTSLPPGVTLCGLSEDDSIAVNAFSKNAAAAIPSTIGRRVIDLAVETDYELYRLAGNDVDLVMTYVLQLYAAISDIYTRDVNTALNLTYVRLWDDPADLFNEIDPLGTFRNYWNANMGVVDRDVAQFISGRRDMPYGGVAWLSALCGSNGYSVCGYFMGSFPDSLDSSVDHYDVHVAAHELGHNFGALHTHSYGVDTCDDFNGTPQRGTIMSYCSQTMSGGNANTDLRFHADVVPFMTNHINASTCLIDDCNANGLDDADDITGGTSADANGNGIPDECEDCNENGVLDEQDISNTDSFDVDGNGVPDECEPDCNQNGVPDAWDISNGPSTDAYGNFIPDECETDCNNNGISDYTEIIADMSLDIDRDAILDSCQDCDNDGTTDLDQLDGAHGIWAASDLTNHIKEFHPISGVRMSLSAFGAVTLAQDLLVSDDDRIFVSSAGDDRIVEFDRHGNNVGDFVTSGLGGLDYPTSMTFGPNGHLFVCSANTNSVLEYDGQTGAFIGVFIAPPPPARASAGLTPTVTAPFGLAFGSNGNLFVTSSDNSVLEFDGSIGTFVSVFVSSTDNGGLDTPRQMLFLPNGNLVIASMLTKELLAYDGATGAPLGKFNYGGTDQALTFDEPWGLRMGPDGFLYASRHGAITEFHGDTVPSDIAELHINSTRIYKYHPGTGDFIRSVVIGNDTQLDGPTGFDFLSDNALDCNYNMLPDACDISAGASQDVNANQVPDECECPADANGNGQVNVTDLLMVLGNWGACDGPCPPACDGDIVADCNVNVTDLLLLLSKWGGCE